MCSMYGIVIYIWVIYGVNVGKYTIHGASAHLNSLHSKTGSQKAGEGFLLCLKLGSKRARSPPCQAKKTHKENPPHGNGISIAD